MGERLGRKLFQWKSWKNEQASEGKKENEDLGRKRKLVKGNVDARTGLKRRWKKGMRRVYG